MRHPASAPTFFARCGSGTMAEFNAPWREPGWRQSQPAARRAKPAAATAILGMTHVPPCTHPSVRWCARQDERSDQNSSALPPLCTVRFFTADAGLRTVIVNGIMSIWLLPSLHPSPGPISNARVLMPFAPHFTCPYARFQLHASRLRSAYVRVRFKPHSAERRSDRRLGTGTLRG